MAANILTAASGAADSLDVAVATNTTVSLKGHDSSSFVIVSLKDDTGAYRPFDVLTWGKPSGVLTGPGTYRFTRTAGSSSCGVFSG